MFPSFSTVSNTLSNLECFSFGIYSPPFSNQMKEKQAFSIIWFIFIFRSFFTSRKLPSYSLQSFKLS
ncbi:predicted protein [Enterococcus faecium 1,141,733]|nr:predicted protein [Enterococcus faecium 1,141,733]